MWSCSSSSLFKHLSCTAIIASRIRRLVRVGPITAHKARDHLSKTTHTLFSPLTSQTHSSLFSAPTNPSPLTSQAHSSSYLSVNILCPKHVVDLLSEALLCFGATSTTVDETDDKSNEICINSIFLEGHDVSLSISQAADSIGLKKVPSFEVSAGDQCDWISKTQESFRPVEVTRGLWIVPEWIDPPDVQATNVILNPGLAFGTGEHPTTKLCLLLLHDSIKGGELFLDYGTGSGVLAIAALKIGCSLSVGVDIEPQAISSARQNADLNNIGPGRLQLHVVQEKPSSHGVEATLDLEKKYDVVIANILLNPLLDLAEDIVSHAKPGGIVGLSGILTEQVPCIMERYSAFLEDVSVAEMGDWACVRGTKKKIRYENILCC